MSRTIKIFDTTLRDGEQSPGCSMNLNEKIEVAKQLEALKVDIIEAGFAAASPGDAAAIAAIADTVRGATICSLARSVDKDIEAAYNAIRRAESARIHTFIATSPVHMEYKLKMTPDEVIESIAHSVSYAKSFCSDVEFSAEDATRTDLDFLCRVVETAIKAGATTINIPDTVGYMIPEEYAARIKYLREHTTGIENIVLSCHMHNDLGMAVANSLAGVEAGIDQSRKAFNSLGFVGTVGNKSDSHTLYDAEGQNTQKALRIDPAVFSLDPYRALIRICFLNKESSRSCMKANVVFYCYFA